MNSSQFYLLGACFSAAIILSAQVAHFFVQDWALNQHPDLRLSGVYVPAISASNDLEGTEDWYLQHINQMAP